MENRLAIKQLNKRIVISSNCYQFHGYYRELSTVVRITLFIPARRTINTTILRRMFRHANTWFTGNNVLKLQVLTLVFCFQLSCPFGKWGSLANALQVKNWVREQLTQIFRKYCFLPPFSCCSSVIANSRRIYSSNVDSPLAQYDHRYFSCRAFELLTVFLLYYIRFC